MEVVWIVAVVVLVISSEERGLGLVRWVAEERICHRKSIPGLSSWVGMTSHSEGSTTSSSTRCTRCTSSLYPVISTDGLARHGAGKDGQQSEIFPIPCPPL